MPDDRRRGVARWVWVVGLIIPLAGAIAGWWGLGATESLTTEVILAAGALALGGFFNVPSQRRTHLSPLYLVVAGMPFMRRVDGERIFDLPAMVAAIGLGLAILWVVQSARRDDPREMLAWNIKRGLSALAYSAGFVVADGMDLPDALADWRTFVLFLVAALSSFYVELLTTLAVSFPRKTRVRRFAVLEMAKDYDIFLTLVATGALFGMAFEAIGWWSAPVAILPYAFAHGALRRFKTVKETYSQTIRALGRIPEVGGHTDPGHAERTARLAVDIAQSLGLRPRDVEMVEYAALLHDIGRVTLNEPSILRMGFTDNDIARWGSEIVAETSYLSDVANVVLRQHEPYRSPGITADPDVPVPARIIKVCSAYDESHSELGFSPLEAMERLHQGSVYDFDPDVVAELRKLLDRNGIFDHPSRTA